jgi:hypothetical protein
MDKTTRTNLVQIRSEDRALQNKAFMHLLEATDQRVDWAYEAWDELLAGLSHKNNRVRAISAQLLCNLARSDPQGRMLHDFPALLRVTKDERFVTARHCLQSLWKVGLASERQRAMVVEALDGRFGECQAEKNGTLIRYDIQQGLRNLYDEVQDVAIRAKALALIETEADPKYRQKYTSLWKKR